MTPSSKEFVTPLTLSTVSKNDVFSEFTTEKNNNPTWNNHVELAEWADIFIIAVPTPFLDNHQPNLSYVKKAVFDIASVLTQGNLIIIESTCPVGTTEKVSEWLSDRTPSAARGALR